MEQPIFPTKGNLIATKKSLQLSSLGFELLDRKRNILVRELMLKIDDAKRMKAEIAETFERAYKALEEANITLGLVEDVAKGVPVDDGLSIGYKSVMGVEIPTVQLEERPPVLCYGLTQTNSKLDAAYMCFHEAKRMSAKLAEVENSVYRLASAISKTQKRANALQNIVIPRFSRTLKFISDALEEKEREEFSRMKVIKKQKEAHSE
ncbi:MULTISPECIES: V-type ATP synthase subunit D [Oscillospiraceae]|uniref:V-type ATP synthase subunit D n=1 Tax=Harryflintia acetispora TaxID=1849041 RepID=A0A9X8Y7U3_9FIRM|nr:MULTISPECIES: V-type ATP synthase subunit D [Oscillospiraceae]RGB66084.1 V-type ATP synthase subunit D [Harryflintia acetispora]TCL42710.1 V/A-type H+-transporting ATPase subunit D [Harryflintia acetispora]